MLERGARTEGRLELVLVATMSAPGGVLWIRVNPVPDEAQCGKDFSDELDALGVGKLNPKER